ncbi:MAG TPA: type IV toxin-antitoxin system AbiEi family antitoxin [Flavitalea sp.]|nr:type IV toxin-antitoxin system AbiEi family antitoxin [Flavitalea sp.]
MKNKHISTRSGELLRYFHEKGEYCFRFPEARKALPQSAEGAIRELLSDMTKRGLLMRVKDGLYYIIPFEANPETFMPEWHLLAKYLVGDAEHYIGYYSALQLHDLITQPSLKEQIVVSKQINPSELLIKNVSFQFIYHNKRHFFGYKKMWADNFNKVRCSDLEKTIIDCLFKPNYAGGIVEITKAINLSREKISYEKLLKYVKQFNSQAVIKRLGFLLEILEINTNITDELRDLRSNSYAILDTELPKDGKYISRWRILQNIETATITSAIYT